MNKKIKIYYQRIILFSILYTSLLLVSSLSAQESSAQIGFGGLGLQITIDNGRFIILGVLPNTPAEQAELASGSTIVAIDGEPTTGKTLEQVVGKLRGEVNTPVHLTILPQNALIVGETTREIELKRAFIPIPATTPTADTSIKSSTPDIESTTVRGSVTYYLITIPKSGQIIVDSPMLVRMMVDNPKGIYADTLAISLSFDPKIFFCSSSAFNVNTSLVNDWNITTTGLDTIAGKVYLVCRTAGPKLIKSGYIAELRLIPKQATSETNLSYLFKDWGKYPNTAVLCRDKDILGSEFDHKDGTIGTRLRIDKE